MERSRNKAAKTVLETGFWWPESRVHLPGFATPFLSVSCSRRSGILTFFTSFSISILSVSMELNQDEEAIKVSNKTATYGKQRLAGQ